MSEACKRTVQLLRLARTQGDLARVGPTHRSKFRQASSRPQYYGIPYCALGEGAGAEAQRTGTEGRGEGGEATAERGGSCLAAALLWRPGRFEGACAGQAPALTRFP